MEIILSTYRSIQFIGICSRLEIETPHKELGERGGGKQALEREACVREGSMR